MPYSFRVLPVILSPLGDSPVEAQLVQGISQVTPGNVIVIREDVAEVVSRPVVGGQVDFMTGPGPVAPASRIGVRLVRQAPGIAGPLFRSGWLELPLVPGSIPELEIVEAPWFVLSEPAINEMIRGGLPSTVQGTTVNSATIVINEGTFTVRAMGTTPGGPLGTINFTAEGPFAAAPASSMHDVAAGAQSLITFSPTATPSVQLAGSGPSIPEAQVIIALLQGLVGPQVGRVMTTALNAQVNSRVPQVIGTALSRVGGPSTLPASITASLERVLVGTHRTTPDVEPVQGIHILAALGSFSGVIATLFPSAGGGGGGRGCSTGPAMILAIAATHSALRVRRRRHSA